MQKILRWTNLTLILLTFLAYLAPHVSPVSFWPLAFFGLTYPWLLLLNFLFIIYWAVRRDRYVWFSVACIALGWGHVQSIIGLHLDSNPSDDAIGVYSFNVHGFKYASDMRSRASVEDFAVIFENENVDIICIQEFSSLDKFSEPHVQFLKNKKGLKYTVRKEDRELAIFSAYPILNSETVKFNGSNGYQYADLNISGQTVRIFNIHLQSNAVSSLAERLATEGDIDDRETWLEVRGMAGRFKRAAQKRATQAEEIAAQIAQSPYPVIVCGDFNDVPQSYTYQTISNNLQDAFRYRGTGPGFSYLGRIPALRIDYILTAPAFDIKAFDLHRTDFSDHRAISAQLLLREN